ncbi:MAG: Bug family tripartite tricarboxylate transporter substrate binding protein [Hyphomicrobiaceae bacterium]
MQPGRALRIGRTAVLSALVSAAIGLTGAAQAADFYAGKTLTIVAGTAAGGGHDIFARMLARHLGNHIPGKPTVIVQNMPGAGGKRATDYIYNQVPKDGTVIGGVFPGAILGPLLYIGEKVRYDPLKFQFIGSGDSDTRICAVLKTSKIQSFKDLLTLEKPAVFGASGPGGSTYDYAWMISNLAGAKLRVVTGYRGTPPVTLAMERGEVDALCGWGWSIFKSERSDWKTNNAFRFLVQMALTPEPELVELGVPDFYSFLGAEEKKVAELILSQQAFSRPYIAPPQVPADRVKILRTAFSKSLADPALVADFARINITNKPTSGAELQKMIASLYASPPDVIAKARAALVEKKKK